MAKVKNVGLEHLMILQINAVRDVWGIYNDFVENMVR